MDQYDGPERRISPQLTDAQIEAITGHTPMEPLVTMYQMILGGLGVGGAMAWKAK